MSEEIKLITETLQNLSGTALYAFVFYLIVGKILPLLIGWTGGIALLCIVLKKISHIIDNTAPSIQIVKQLRDNLGIGHPGALSSTEIGEVRAAIPNLLPEVKS